MTFIIGVKNTINPIFYVEKLFFNLAISFLRERKSYNKFNTQFLNYNCYFDLLIKCFKTFVNIFLELIDFSKTERKKNKQRSV